MIDLAITHGIDTESKATEHSVGFQVHGSSVKKTLLPGNVVTLYNCSQGGSFLRVQGKRADCNGGHGKIDRLPLKWSSERFLVVDAGNETIAFYNPIHRRFLGFQNGTLSAEGYPIVHANESPRANECFQVVEVCVRFDMFRLRCPIEEVHDVVPLISNLSSFTALTSTLYDELSGPFASFKLHVT